MRRHFSPPQLPFSSLPIPPLPPTLCIPPPSLLPLIHLIFLVLQHLLTLLLGSSFIHPLHSPSFSPPSSPLLTLLFPVSPSFFSFSSSSCSPLSSTVVFSFFPSLLPFTILLYPFIVLSSFSSSSSSSFPLSWSSCRHSHLSLIFLLLPILFLLLLYLLLFFLQFLQSHSSNRQSRLRGT